MSSTVLQAVLASDLQPLGLRMTAVVMAWRANAETGHIWASLSTIAVEAGITRDRVKQVIKKMKSAGVLEVVASGAGGARRSTTTYAFSAAWLGKHGSRVPALPGKQDTQDGALPGKRKERDPVTRTPIPGNEAYPNRDERKTPKVSSLSSIAHVPASAGDTAEGRASSTTSAPGGEPRRDGRTAMKTEQPPRRIGKRKRSVSDELDEVREKYEAKGIELGLGSFADAAARGVAWFDHVRNVVLADRKRQASR